MLPLPATHGVEQAIITATSATFSQKNEEWFIQMKSKLLLHLTDIATGRGGDNQVSNYNEYESWITIAANWVSAMPTTGDGICVHMHGPTAIK